MASRAVLTIAICCSSIATARHIYTERFGDSPSTLDLTNTKIVFTGNGKDPSEWGKKGYAICTAQAERLAFEPEYLPASESKDDAIISPIELSCLCPDPETNLCGCSAGSECCESSEETYGFGWCTAQPGKCYDDQYGEVPFEQTFQFYGEEYTSVFVNINGQLTFSAPPETSSSYDETLHEHFAHPGVSALFDDLVTKDGLKLLGFDALFPDQVADAGTIYHRALSPRESKRGGIVITWVRVPEVDDGTYAAYSQEYIDTIDTNLNTFQVALEYDGTITLSYLTLTTTDGIVGLSDGGGLEEFFVPVDFTSCHYSTGACGAVRDACVTQPGGVAVAGDGGGLDEQQQGALSAIEGVEVVGFLLQIGTFLLAALLAWPTLRPLVLGGNGYGGNGAAGAAAMGGGSVQIGAPPRGAATGGYSVMSENKGYEAPLTASEEM